MLDECLQPDVEPGRAGLLSKDESPVPHHPHRQLQVIRVTEFGSGYDHRPDRARPSKALGLRKIERVLAFDVTAAQIITECVAEDDPGRPENERTFRLGNLPRRVAPQAHAPVGADDPRPGGFEEQFRARGRVDPLVDIGLMRLQLPGGEAALVRHPGRPDLSRPHRRQQVRTTFIRLGVFDLVPPGDGHRILSQKLRRRFQRRGLGRPGRREQLADVG